MALTVQMAQLVMVLTVQMAQGVMALTVQIAQLGCYGTDCTNGSVRVLWR